MVMISSWPALHRDNYLECLLILVVHTCLLPGQYQGKVIIHGPLEPVSLVRIQPSQPGYLYGIHRFHYLEKILLTTDLFFDFIQCLNALTHEIPVH